MRLAIVKTVVITACVFVLPVAALAAPLLVFSQDYDNPAFVLPGVTANPGGSGLGVEGVQGFAAVPGFSGNFLRQPTTGIATLLLTNLPAHTSVDVNFLLAIIDSWDGPSGNFAPDFLNFRADGNPLFSQSFSAFSSAGVYVAPAGGQLTPGPPFSHLGFNGQFQDQAYNMGLEPSLSFTHTASTLFFEAFANGAGFQGGIDESFALENFQVVINTPSTVPEPASLVLCATGALGFLASARRRRKQRRAIR